MYFTNLDPFISRSIVFDTDDASGGGGDPKKDDPKKDDPQDKGGTESDDEKLTLSKKELQEKIDSVVKERLEREKRKAEKDAEKLKADAETAALAEQKKYEELSQVQAKKLAEYEKQLAEYDALKDRADRYEKALSANLDVQKKGLPSHILDLLGKLDPVEQLEYLAKNAETLRPKMKGVPETPSASDGKELSAEDKEKASQSASAFYQSRF